MSNALNIPIASDLVALGNPRLKKSAQEYSAPSHIEELNTRIDELESAIGQDNSGPIGRAFAIRAEAAITKTLDEEHFSIKENL